MKTRNFQSLALKLSTIILCFASISSPKLYAQDRSPAISNDQNLDNVEFQKIKEILKLGNIEASIQAIRQAPLSVIQMKEPRYTLTLADYACRYMPNTKPCHLLELKGSIASRPSDLSYTISVAIGTDNAYSREELAHIDEIVPSAAYNSTVLHYAAEKNDLALFKHLFSDKNVQVLLSSFDLIVKNYIETEVDLINEVIKNPKSVLLPDPTHQTKNPMLELLKSDVNRGKRQFIPSMLSSGKRGMNIPMTDYAAEKSQELLEEMLDHKAPAGATSLSHSVSREMATGDFRVSRKVLNNSSRPLSIINECRACNYDNIHMTDPAIRDAFAQFLLDSKKLVSSYASPFHYSPVMTEKIIDAYIIQQEKWRSPDASRGMLLATYTGIESRKDIPDINTESWSKKLLDHGIRLNKDNQFDAGKELFRISSPASPNRIQKIESIIQHHQPDAVIEGGLSANHNNIEGLKTAIGFAAKHQVPAPTSAKHNYILALEKFPELVSDFTDLVFLDKERAQSYFRSPSVRNVLMSKRAYYPHLKRFDALSSEISKDCNTLYNGIKDLKPSLVELILDSRIQCDRALSFFAHALTDEETIKKNTHEYLRRAVEVGTILAQKFRGSADTDFIEEIIKADTENLKRGHEGDMDGFKTHRATMKILSELGKYGFFDSAIIPKKDYGNWLQKAYIPAGKQELPSGLDLLKLLANNKRITINEGDLDHIFAQPLDLDDDIADLLETLMRLDPENNVIDISGNCGKAGMSSSGSSLYLAVENYLRKYGDTIEIGKETYEKFLTYIEDKSIKQRQVCPPNFVDESKIQGQEEHIPRRQ